MAYTKYSLTPANNTAAPPDGAPEGMLPSAVNDTMRDMMAQIRDVGDGIRDGTYTMTAPKITGGTITGATVTSNTFSSSGATITGGTINGTTIGATTASTGKFTAVTNSALTSGRVTYAGASGLLSDSSDFVWDNSNTRLGIGISSPAAAIDVLGSYLNGGSSRTNTNTKTFGFRVPHCFTATNPMNVIGGLSTTSVNYVYIGGSDSNIGGTAATNLFFYTAANNTTADGTLRMSIDSSGNVGIGTSSPANRLHVSGSGTDLVRLQGSSYSMYLYQDAGGVGWTNGSNLAGESIYFNSVNNVMRMYTNSAERMRITSDGDLLVGKTASAFGTTGFETRASGETWVTRSSASPFYINRTTNDGDLIIFYQDGTSEGFISVSGTTVSYNGGHLSRWSQLPDGSRNDTILKGTVMSNLDDMCVWEKDGVIAENEQLNKMKVSDVEGDTNVAGVFVNWTRDEDFNSDDMNVAMTGDMIIRIAQGVVVQKGDLLMSAGNGTAKPQGDDIVRSKTIAKVTSNHVTCTYADGSYCVPCVLMAC
jgi:hypothetical protein